VAKRVRARQPTLSDEVVSLTPYSLRDVRAHLANEDAEFYRWFDLPQSTPESVRAAIRRWQRSWHRARRVVAFAIRDPAGRLAGGCEIRIVSPGIGEVSYWVGRDYRRRGYAARALRLLVGFGFGELGLRRIEAAADTRNAASRAALGRAGFHHEGVLREKWEARDGRRNVAIYAILASQTPPA
jgi:RimJ/RimL family protein N-acetyltransferase